MLYLSGDASKPKRVQGAYVTEKEVRRVADYLREEGARASDNKEEVVLEEGEELQPSQTRLQPSFASFDNGPEHVDFDDLGDPETDDELYEEAKKVVIQAKKASASLLQRRLRVGYARAARLLDMLEENSVIGPGDGAKPREVYIDLADSSDDHEQL